MNIIASIQARMGSTRFPGKVLRPICGKPLLVWQVERLRQSKLLDDCIVATTRNMNDDAIVACCKTHAIRYFRGSENDVLERVTRLVERYRVDIHVELYGDSPLIDAHLIDECIGYFLKMKGELDFVSNALSITYPPGEEVLVYSGKALVKANALAAKNDPLREHVGIHITRNTKLFKGVNLEAPAHYRYPEIYLEVDTPQDFALISNIVRHFVKEKVAYFTLAHILEYLLKHKHLISMNNQVFRRWKAFKEKPPCIKP